MKFRRWVRTGRKLEIRRRSKTTRRGRVHSPIKGFENAISCILQAIFSKRM